MSRGRPTTGGVILAAGGATRFTEPIHKLLTPIHGRPLVERAITALLASGLDDLAIVTGAVKLDHLIPPNVTELPNPSWAHGQATSLARAVEWGTARGLDAIVVGLGDQPGVITAAWQEVAGTSDTPIAVATYAGRRGHPVRLAQVIWGRLPATGDRGAGVLMAESPELVTEVACDGDASDVDTVEDLARWR